MQCVRCAHPLPPRADRCLRCFALNPQNRPDPPQASPAVPIGALPIAPAAMPQRPLDFSFNSEPPLPQENGIGAMSIRSDPPPAEKNPLPDLLTPSPETRAPSGRAQFDELSPPEYTFDDPSISRPPQRVIDLGDPRQSSPGEPPSQRQQLHFNPRPPVVPDTIPDPKPSPNSLAPEPRTAETKQNAQPPLVPQAQLQPLTTEPKRAAQPLAPQLQAKAIAPQPELTPAPMIDVKAERKKELPIAPGRAQLDQDAQAALDRLAQAALHLSDPNLPMVKKTPAEIPGVMGPKAKIDSPDLDGLRALPPSADEPRPQLSARLKAWSFDGFLIALLSLLFVGVAAFLLGGPRLAPLGKQSWESWADGLLFAHKLPLFWALLACALALSYSWLFAALGGRTPGMRVAGLKLLREDGEPLDAVQALWRALIAVPSALLGLFGFFLALVDPRGQTLQDKLTHSLLVVSGAKERESAEPL